jgi:trimethylamine--corrinoid protein Co-methyltransferase
MLRNWSEFLSPGDITQIHQTSMKLLAEIGIFFAAEQAVEVFKKQGFKTDGKTVFFDEKQVMAAVEAAPTKFTIHARHPDKQVKVGGGNPVFAPGYGAPFIIDYETGRREATMADYEQLARLADALPNQDLSGHLLVEPGDLPAGTAHLHMLQASMVHSDKPFMSSTEGTTGARHTLKMAEILFGQKPEQPVTIGLINSHSPLAFAEEMLHALLVYAAARQPVIIAALAMAGSTGPITLAGILAMQNAEILAGITLAQLISPGTPVVYGSTSTNLDMKTGGLCIGSPELSLVVTATAQLARHYGLPCRSGGSLTDAHSPDAQAGLESMMSLLTVANSGVDFVLHAAGILGSYLTFSYEKFVLDDEMCGMIRQYRRGIEVSPDTLAYEVIANVGAHSNYLVEDHTLIRCRTEFWQPSVLQRGGLEGWQSSGRPQVIQFAHQRWQKLLAEHQDPPLDETTRRQLQAYVDSQGG